MILCVSCDWFHQYIYILRIPSLYIYGIHVQHFRMNEHGSFAYLYIGSTVWSCLFHLVMYWLSYWIGHYLIWCMSQVQIFLYLDVHRASRMPRASPAQGPTTAFSTRPATTFSTGAASFAPSASSTSVNSTCRRASIPKQQMLG